MSCFKIELVFPPDASAGWKIHRDMFQRYSTCVAGSFLFLFDPVAFLKEGDEVSFTGDPVRVEPDASFRVFTEAFLESFILF